MQLIPAIDIRNGECVRLIQGDPDRQIDYSNSPVDIARDFVRAGAEKIHVVDLDGALEGTSSNEQVVAEIVEAVPVKIELGGGIRTLDRMKFWLDLGVHQVILGTVAVQQPELVQKAIETFGSDSIIVGVDAREGKVATHGWKSVSEVQDTEFAQTMTGFGVNRFVYTAIETDGMLTGPNLKALRNFAGSTDAIVTASGGIGNIEDLKILLDAGIRNVDSVIAGRAIYENALDVSEAVQELKKVKN